MRFQRPFHRHSAISPTLSNCSARYTAFAHCHAGNPADVANPISVIRTVSLFTRTLATTAPTGYGTPGKVARELKPDLVASWSREFRQQAEKKSNTRVILVNVETVNFAVPTMALLARFILIPCFFFNSDGM